MTSAALVPTLLAATVATGLTAGFLAAFAHTVMPGLGRTDDAVFVGAFQGIDRAVANPWFMVPFFAGPLLLGVAFVVVLTDRRLLLASVVGVALLCSVATLLVTTKVHLPLNDAVQDVVLRQEGADLSAARERFEPRWVRWNVVRTTTSTVALTGSALALHLLR